MRTLAIGYGNTLRGDDGAGQAVAEAIAALSLPEVRVRSLHQLTPDLAADIAEVDRVFFIDAILWGEEISPRVRIHGLTPQEQNSSLGHYCEPRSLLAWSELLYDRLPSAYWVLIPGLNFAFGETFSDVTQGGIAVAIAAIHRFCLTEGEICPSLSIPLNGGDRHSHS
ncbi:MULTISPECIES: hydrogenase maturation protease [Spirulina sp. CCY15215]|uniref:hydrogenase maturation protease n=1 Tax=Spirulina sp. CCY15215 TaxID=2767591 RepID=UPI001EF22AC4|nr:hydrogenase maturation protease [Spirulina major]